MLPELRKGLYTALKLVLGAVYYVEAPAGQALPYVVFSSVTASVRWDTMKKDDEQYVQINGYGKDLGALETIRESIRTLLDNNPGAITLTSPYTVYDVTEQLNRAAKLEDVWQFTLQYKITIQKS